jgi:hypothetical protein
VAAFSNPIACLRRAAVPAACIAVFCAALSAAGANAPKPEAPITVSFVDRVRNFVRKLWPSGS